MPPERPRPFRPFECFSVGCSLCCWAGQIRNYHSGRGAPSPRRRCGGLKLSKRGRSTCGNLSTRQGVRAAPRAPIFPRAGAQASLHARQSFHAPLEVRRSSFHARCRGALDARRGGETCSMGARICPPRCPPQAVSALKWALKEAFLTQICPFFHMLIFLRVF